MSSQTKLISQSLFNRAVSELEALGKYGKLSTRLQLIIVSKNINISAASKALGFSRASIVKWIKRFEKDGIYGLEDKNGRGRKSLFTKEIKVEIKKLIESDPNITLKALRLKIAKKFNTNLSKSAIHNHINILSFSHITPRPCHYQQDKDRLDEFKKNSKRIKGK